MGRRAWERSACLKQVLSCERSLIGHRALLPGLLHGYAIVVFPELADEDPGECTMTESSHNTLSRSISCPTASGTRFVLSRISTSTSSVSSPPMPRCRNHRVSLRTGAGCVWVFRARCRNVRSAKRTTGQKPAGPHTAVKDVLTRAPYRSAAGILDETSAIGTHASARLSCSLEYHDV